MARYAALLRGINLGSHNQLKMPLLKEIAADLGYADPATYLHSGNLALTTGDPEATVVADLGRAIAERTGLAIPVIVRTHDELVAAVEGNPLPEPADHARFFVTFCPGPVGNLGLDPEAYGEQKAAATGREIYSWYPDGMGTSKLAPALARKGGKAGTARNWRTVLALVEMTAE